LIGTRTRYFLTHGKADDLAAIVAIGKIVRHQPLILAFSEAFGVIGVVLAVAAAALLFAGKSRPHLRGQGRIESAASRAPTASHGESR
jgi:DHA2 family multidrug resistance protein